MKKLIIYIIISIIIYGVYLFYEQAGESALEKIRLSESTKKDYVQQTNLLEKVANNKDYLKWIAMYQKYEKSGELARLPETVRKLASEHHVQVKELQKSSGHYELALLADLDADVFHFWQTLSRHYEGLVHPISFGLFRSSTQQDQIQGRITFAFLLE